MARKQRGFIAPDGRRYLSRRMYIKFLQREQAKILNGNDKAIDAKLDRTYLGAPVNKNAFQYRGSREKGTGGRKKVFAKT